MFTLAYHYFVCFSTIDLFTLRVWLSLESNCVFFNHRFIYFACLTFTGIKLYVFPSRVRSLCVFIIENGYFVCLKKLSVHFECLRLLMFTLCVWIMYLWLCMLFVNYASHFVCFISSDCVLFWPSSQRENHHTFCWHLQTTTTTTTLTPYTSYSYLPWQPPCTVLIYWR